jgi:hypothetical protein
MRFSARGSLVLLLAVALASLPSLAAAVPEPLSLADAVKLAGELGGPEEHPDANSITAFDRTWIEFEEDGAYEQYNHTFTKVLTDEGRDDNGSVSMTYHRRYGSIDVVMARVIKADGTEIVVEEDLITEGTPPAVSAMNIFEADFREVSVVFPGLEVGDAVEYMIHEDYEPLLDNGFNGIYFLQYIEPIAESTVTIVGPESLPLVHIVKNGSAEFTESTDGGRTIYTWTTHDTPRIEREMAMAPPRQFAKRLIVSTVPTWEEMSRHFWKMVDEKCVVEDSISDLVAEITDGLTTNEDKIRAIHYWILENVRYLGIAMDRGAFLEPHFASYTLEKEYGICRDKATLMITMLKEIGVPSWMVAINPSHRMDTEIPTVFFEHGIVAIKGGDGEYLYIDPTIEETREVYASYVGDRHLLVATEEGENLRQAPHVPATDNAGDIMDRATLSSDGAIAGNVTITGSGFYELILRTVNKNMGPEQFEDTAEQMVQSIYPGAELRSFSVTDADDLYEPTMIELSYHIDDYALDAGPYTLFRVPAASGSFELLSDFLFGRITGLPERKYPVALGVTLGVDEMSEVALPDGFVVENLPNAVDFEAGAISLSITYEYEPGDTGGGTLRYNRRFGIDAFEISPEDYINLKEAVRLAAGSEKGEVILKREEG